MHQSLARYSAPVSLVHAPSWADFITTMVGFKVFGTHTPAADVDFHSLDIAKFVRNGHQQNVELSACELVQQDWSRSLPHVQLELRQRSAQMRQQRGQDIGPDCRDYPEPQRPGQWLLRVVGPPDQFLGVDQQALGARRDLFPQRRQHHVAMAALKQRDAQPCLELLDPSAERRLRDGTTFRSTAEMASLG